MARELRRIYLNTNDLTHAFESFRVDKPQFLPNGRLSHIAVLDEHLLLKIEMKYLDNIHVLEFKVEYEKLAEMLVAFCLEHRIAVAAGSRKAVFPENGEVVLEIAAANDDVASKPGELTRWRDRVA